MLLKIITVARQAGHCMRDERLQVETVFYCFKNNHSSKAGKKDTACRDERLQVQYSILLLKTTTLAR